MDKNSILITIMVFCLVVIVFQLGFNSGDFSWLKAVGGLLLASLAAGATLAATGGMKK